jgi:hypothetical protein
MEDLGIGGRMILKMCPQEPGWKGVEWIYSAQDRDQWQAYGNMVMNLQVL